MKYLLLPMQPTPNGRMHLGHAAGTYLRADVLARSLRSGGHEVKVACGTDAYENWVLAAADRDGRTPHSSCSHYHQGITRDLAALEVQFDAWVDPLSDEHRRPYIDLHDELFAEVSAAPTARLVTERIPYSEADGSPLMGTFIAGDCPSCGAPAGGSSCTACGDHFRPDQLVNPRARLSGTTVTWRQEPSWFLQPRSGEALVVDLRATGLHEQHVAVAERFLARTGGLVRLSGPGTWGVPGRQLGRGHVLSNSYFLYCLYAARCVADLTDPEPFAAGSPVVTVGIFGTDNSIPGLIVPGLYRQATLGRLKAFDHTVVNGMLDLDGQKFSTSKSYGIWLEDVIASTLVTADELRYALSGLPLDRGRANLDLSRLAVEVEWFRRTVTQRVGAALSELAGQPVAADPDAALLALQRENLQPGRCDLPRARAFLATHLEAPFAQPREWLATLAALADPFTPKLSQAIQHGTLTGAVVGRGEVRAAQLEAVVRRGDRS